MEDVGDKFKKEPILTPARWFLESDGIYKDMKEIMDKYHIAYDDSELKRACTALYEMVDFSNGDGCLFNTILELIPSAVAGNKDLSRMVYLHMPDMALIMLCDYLKELMEKI